MLLFRKDKQQDAAPADVLEKAIAAAATATIKSIDTSGDAGISEATQHAKDTGDIESSDAPGFLFSSPLFGKAELPIDRHAGDADGLIFPSERDDIPSADLAAAMETELPEDTPEDIDLLISDESITFEGHGPAPEDPVLPSNTIIHRQKIYDKDVAAFKTWKEGQKADLEKDRKNSRVVAEGLAEEKQAASQREARPAETLVSLEQSLQQRMQALARQEAEVTAREYENEELTRREADLTARLHDMQTRERAATAAFEERKRLLAVREAEWVTKSSNLQRLTTPSTLDDLRARKAAMSRLEQLESLLKGLNPTEWAEAQQIVFDNLTEPMALSFTALATVSWPDLSLPSHPVAFLRLPADLA